MGGFIFHVSADAACPHQGKIATIVSNPQVKVSNQAVATLNDTYSVAGCTFTLPNGKPQPCIQVQWLKVATRVKVKGNPVVLKSSQGICKTAEEIPQGLPSIKITQQRVKGI